jgi:hypothetical protein
MTRFSILMKGWLRHGVHNFVLRNLGGLGMASDFRRMRPLLLPFLALLFIAAPSGPAEAGAHSLDSKELLNTAYPKARIDAPTVGTNAAPLRIASINLPNVKWPWFPQPGHDTTSDTDSTTVEIVPLNVNQFDEQHAVMITRAVPLDDQGERICSSYGCLFAIGAYFFTHTASGWDLMAKVESVAPAYSLSDETGVYVWPGHGLLFAASLPFFAQGDESDSMLLIGLEPGRVTFAGELPILEQNYSSMDMDCSTYVSPEYKPQQRTRIPGGFECRVGRGEWAIDGDEIRATYERYIRTADANGRLLPLKHKMEVVRLVPRDGKLKVLSGTLPEFGF